MTNEALHNQVMVGISHQNAGDLTAAEQIYRQILSIDPDYSDALSLLGLVCQATSRLNEALQLLNRALAQKIHPVYLVNRSSILLSLEQHALAATDAKGAIKLDPQNESAYINLLQAYRSLGEHRRAIKLGVEAIQLFPQSTGILNNYGACLLDAGQQDEAYDAFGRAEKMDAYHCVALENLARIAWVKGSFEKAEGYSQRAYDLGSGDVQVLLPWINAMLERIAPEDDLPNLIQDIWLKVMSQGALAQLKAAAHDIVFINSVFQVASTFQAKHHFAQSHAILQRLLEILPDNADVLNNLGVSYFVARDYAQALIYFERAVAIDNTRLTSQRNAGVCHFMLNQHEQALTYFAAAYQIDKTSCASLLMYFGQCLQCCDWRNYHELKDNLIDITLSQPEPDDLTASLAFLAAVEKAEDMRVIASKVGRGIFRHAPKSHEPASVAQAFEQPRRLRIGYFSYDFRNHPVAYLTEELYGLHDRSRFEVFALSYGDNDQSSFRKTIETDVEHFVELSDLTSTDMLERIRALNLDIVVDLTGNTQNTKSAVLAARVAPIQCHWLGYVWSMGHAAYDYIIADPFSIPTEFEHAYVEHVARLPHTLQISSRRLTASDNTFTRAQMGLPDDAFVMANFGAFAKMQPDLFAVWMHILKTVPQSVLWLARTHRTPLEAFERIAQQIQAHGVDASRVIFSEPMSREEHLRRYELADLALDTYPQGSGTTAIESLWMGCPMLSMAGAGETLAIRMAGGILNAVGLNDLVVNSLEAYQTLGVKLASNPEMCQQYRAHLQHDKTKLPLFDTPKTVAYLETCFETMWAQMTANNPHSFTVPYL